MKTKLHHLIVAAATVCAATTSVGASAVANFVLPTPENNSYATYGSYKDALGFTRDAIMMNGIPIAFRYDNYWSYSAHVLDALQNSPTTNFLPVATWGTYDFSVGTGTIAVNLTTNAGGATNVNPNGSGVNFQDPVNLASNNNVLGWTGVWGGNTQSYNENPPSPNPPASGKDYSVSASTVGGTSTVGNMLTYLHTLDPLASIPVIYADYNQTGNYDSLWVSAMAQIVDPITNQVKAQWNLDRLDGNGLNIDQPTFNYGELNFYGTQAACTAAGAYDPITNPGGCAGVTTNGDSYLKLEHNKGSGKPDFLTYAPGMDLTKFASTDLLVFTVNVGCIPGGPGPLDGISLGCNTNGGEEFGIVGAVAPSHAPEPGSLFLMGIGLMAAGVTMRRRIRGQV